MFKSDMNKNTIIINERKWFYPAVYLLFLILSFLPLYTERPYSYEHTQEVIISLLSISIVPFNRFGIIFHISTLVLVLLMIFIPKEFDCLFPFYVGLNYLVIAFTQSIGRTERYGLVVHTGNLAISAVLGVIWLGTSIRGNPRIHLEKIRWHHIVLFPLALLAFWSPYQIKEGMVFPDFNPLFLLTSPDYGFTLCFTTPVFLYLLMIFYREINRFAIRATAFCGLLFALYNLTHWFQPESRWMGVLHLPLLVISVFTFFWAKTTEKKFQ